MAQFTLWRGDKVIVRVELAETNDALTLGGSMEPSDELEALGPMIQHTGSREGRSVVVQEPMQRDAFVDHGKGPVPIHANHGPVFLAPPDSVLYLRDAASNIVPVDFIWVAEPIMLRTGFLDDAPPELLQHFKQWRLMCRLSAPLDE